MLRIERLVRRRWLRFCFLLLLGALLIPTAVACQRGAIAPAPHAGVALGGQMELAAFEEKVGVDLGYAQEYFAFPEVNFSSEVNARLEAFMAEAVAAEAIPIVTVEPFGGLNTVTVESARDFGRLLAEFDTEVIVRFAHEMNAPWYEGWGQQPEAYKEKFRLFAQAVKAEAPQARFAWTPNQEWGFPWGGTPPGDAYYSYYPGDDVVDWVGLSIYHRGWSSTLETEGHHLLPEDTYVERALTSFVDQFPGKQMMIAETSALYRPSVSGEASETEIKSNWLNQLFSPRVQDIVDAVVFFNVIKEEGDFGVVDWRISEIPELSDEFASLAAE